MPGAVEGKVAIITGASRGQGEAEARMFADEGASVVVADVLDEPGQKVAESIGKKARYHHLDISSEQQWNDCVAATLAAFGRLDILVNNAAILKTAPILEMSLDDYLAVIKVNQVGTWLGMRAVAPAIRDAGGGAIVNVSSIGGLKGIPNMSAYVSSKFAVRGMTKVAAIEFGPYNIRVNSIHPGAIDTDMASRDSGRHAKNPIPRIGTPEEIGKLALFLASDMSSFCTGAEFIADGGTTAGL
jgi:3alpha(or 20beta)-hydroxysteroid dehydrogenase